jgi:hypothetical protein
MKIDFKNNSNISEYKSNNFKIKKSGFNVCNVNYSRM